MSDFTIILARKNKLNNLNDKLTKFIKNHKPEHSSAIHMNVSSDFLFFKADISKNNLGKIYVDKNDNSTMKSFCIYFGWCYKINSYANSIGYNDMSDIITHHRKNSAPYDDYLSGNYTLISYDSVTDTMWITADLWASYGFYYGSNKDFFVISSKSSIVANLINSCIDGISYMSLLRGTALPPGRSLFCNVHRITAGRGIRINITQKTANLIETQRIFNPIKHISFNDALDNFINVVSRVSIRAADSQSAIVDLTGGNDSRLTAAVLSLQGNQELSNKLVFKVVGAENELDVIIAKAIADIYGWKLLTCEREISFENSIDYLINSTKLLDGYLLPLPESVLEIYREQFLFSSYDNLIGSLGGELFRDFFWRHEKLNMKNPRKVNFKLLLKYRLYANESIDSERISNGKLNLKNHNNELILPYRALECKFPDIHKYYLLDIIYLHKLFSNSKLWCYSPFRRTLLPFLTSEVTSVSLSTYWKCRTGRKLMTSAIERLSPNLSAIPNDDGAPMRPKKLSTLHSYISYYFKDIATQINKRIIYKNINPSSLSLPSQWLEYLLENNETRSYYDTGSLLSNANSLSTSLTLNEYRELGGLLMLKILFKNYSNLSHEIKFDSIGPDMIKEEIALIT